LEESSVLVAVRIRGPSELSAETELVLRLLNLTKINHAVILPNDESVRGMLRKVNAYVTWGEPCPELITKLLKRGDPNPGINFGEELSALGVSSLEELAQKLFRGEIEPSVVRRLFKPAFRLHPPRGGFKGSTKRPIGQKGVLGYAGKEIAGLLRAMC